jgi:hypothetical protein
MPWAGLGVTADEWFFVTTLYGEMTLDGQRTHIRAFFPRFAAESGIGFARGWRLAGVVRRGEWRFVNRVAERDQFASFAADVDHAVDDCR